MICPAFKYKCISHRTLNSTHTVIFGHYLLGPDADWQPEEERFWTELLIPWTTDSPGLEGLFIQTLIFIRKLRGISTTNRKGVDISNFILIAENLWQGYKSFLHHNKLLEFALRKENKHHQVMITQTMKNTNPTAKVTGHYSFVPCTHTLHWLQSSNGNFPSERALHQTMLNSPSSPSLLLPILVQPEVRFSLLPSGRRSMAHFRVIYIIPPSHSSIKLWKLPLKIPK